MALIFSANDCSAKRPSFPKNHLGISLPQAQAYGITSPGVRQVPESSPTPLTGVCHAKVLIYKVLFMYGGVFGCQNFLCVVFAHIGGRPVGNIIKPSTDDFGREAFLANPFFWRYSYLMTGFGTAAL